MTTKKPSFTLIEMLIVIVIIGILAAALVPRLRDVQGRARDAKRKADMSQIYNAFSLYNADNGFLMHTYRYSGGTEIASRGGRDYSSSGQFLIWLISGGIMNTVPVDPINNAVHLPGFGAGTGTFSYRYFCYKYSINGAITGEGLHIGYFRESPTTRTYIHYNNGDEKVSPTYNASTRFDTNYICGY